MQVAILCAATGWHTDELSRALTERGHTGRVLPYEGLVARLGTGRGVASGLFVQGMALLDADAVLARIIPNGSLEQIIYRMDALHWIEKRGVPVMNSPRAIERSVDKFYTTALLQEAGLPTPETVVCEGTADAMEAVLAMGDVIIKPVFGSMGHGMVRVSDPDVAFRVVRSLEQVRAVFYVQRAVDHGGRDVRVFVVGGRVLGAIERQASDGGWRTNVSRGGAAYPFDLPPAWGQLALRAATAVGADYAGVDLLPSRDGTVFVLEVNGIPGWQGLQLATESDVAGAIVDHLVRRVRSGAALAGGIEDVSGLTIPGGDTDDQGARARPIELSGVTGLRASAASHPSRTASDVTAAAQLACLLEVSAPKPGNVSPGHNFADASYGDFLASAAAIGRPLAGAAQRPIGTTVRLAIEATAGWTRSNTNLGIVLLLAPLARAALLESSLDGPASGTPRTHLRDALGQVLEATSVDDAREVYAAIRRAAPGGLGRADAQDVADDPTLTLLEVMRLAADRDAIAREYATSFEVTFEMGAPALDRARSDGLSWDDAIVETYLTLLAAAPDTHIARRRGSAAAAEVSRQACAALAAGGVRSPAGSRAIDELDLELRGAGHAVNPGATADLTAAAIFVVLLSGGWEPSPDSSATARSLSAKSGT